MTPTVEHAMTPAQSTAPGAGGRRPAMLTPQRAEAVDALALGAAALAFTALAVVSVGLLVIGRARIGRLEIEELVVGRVRFRSAPSEPLRGSGRTLAGR